MPKSEYRFVTDMTLDRVRTPQSGRRGYRVKHCPGLYLMVTSTGHKSWVVMLRIDGKQTKETLGSIDKIPTVTAAVGRARALQDQTRAGVDPRKQRKAEAERK